MDVTSHAMKTIGFKLWRWVGRKCGWYVEPPLSPIERLTKLVADESDKFHRAALAEWNRNADAWTGPIKHGVFPDVLKNPDAQKTDIP